MHLPDEQVQKHVHPATKMCTPGAGCTLNFEHCFLMVFGTRTERDHAQLQYEPSNK